MEHVSEALPKVTNTSSASENAVLEEVVTCSMCGRDRKRVWVEFPAFLQKRFGVEGNWDVLPCTDECERYAERAEWDRERRLARVEILQRKSNISPRMRRNTFETFDASVSELAQTALGKVRAYVREWDNHREAGNGLILAGGVGTGKSHLAVAAMHWLIEVRQVPALFVTAPELLENMRDAYDDPQTDDWLKMAQHAELLVLDDLGAEKPTEWARERWFVILNHRYREALPTICTTNHGPAQLEDLLDARIGSRLAEMCNWILLDGPDYRQPRIEREDQSP